MKRIIALLTLTCALSVSSIAGEIPTCRPLVATGGAPTVGAKPVAGNIPTENSSTVSSDAESSTLITVLLTVFSLIGR